jgi:hypothetical protein
MEEQNGVFSPNSPCMLLFVISARSFEGQIVLGIQKKTLYVKRQKRERKKQGESG